MQVRLLGPVELRDGERGAVPVGPRARAVLAALALEAGRPVSVERLIGAVWPDRPPATSTTQIHGCVSALRRALGPARDLLVTRPPGYLLRLEAEAVDALGFGARVREARAAERAGDAERASRLLREALGGWEGPALSGVPGLYAEAALLEEQRLLALEERIRVDLARGAAAELVPELTRLCAGHPLRERFHAQLMVALARSGRRPEALEVYGRARRVLVAELGVEPGPELSRTHLNVLTGPGAAETTLPHDPADFTGREPELARVSAALAAPGGALPIVAVSGRPGAGATALAVRAAHRMRARFPDGRLYVDLHFTADPVEVLGRLLRMLGVAELPVGRAERAELYRARTHGRRLLIVLDGAGGERQVLPLLPGGDGPAVLVTGRTRLSALPGAVHVELDPLPRGDALLLLARIAGAERVAAEPGAAARIVDLCDRLPLAVRAAAARLAGKPHWRLADFVRRLSDEDARLGELAHGDLDVRPGLAATHARLSAPARRAFARLADGSFDREGRARQENPENPSYLESRENRESRDALEELVDARLLEAVPGPSGHVGFRPPGLVRCFAREFARELTSRPEVGNATEEWG
ncbi:AfsR/SARP family transcriptional regulator [Actinocorallia sp. A-T 12471]|uniref:AfsR/SARP family transcriptional regulator n=1 Tax=Actinocorallia sp. A-T 12471 TaxID=3089813 RepID=UPI0029CB80C9|nr:AfsR/SARP family transcriptional regulator [Actinocorallia sp. A-T 12471]MDX6744412.1 AfsR/SARP family transcriptional regulator [Actinocorallia sp. A-T 12471]